MLTMQDIHSMARLVIKYGTEDDKDWLASRLVGYNRGLYTLQDLGQILAELVTDVMTGTEFWERDEVIMAGYIF